MAHKHSEGKSKAEKAGKRHYDKDGNLIKKKRKKKLTPKEQVEQFLKADRGES